MNQELSALLNKKDAAKLLTSLKADGRILSITANEEAMAAVKLDGSVVTWGHGRRGGNSALVQDQLATDVQHVCSTEYAFAAVKSDGSILSWGHEHYGGNCCSVREQLDLMASAPWHPKI
eukprot:gnl/MRDRNA2_/MRDRNA2_15236_c0_seq1.p1 gnl/MRDRNA2_/MRDRNA2_15236_c0~~gnl/MRDRNA2_/MRDRNA2_15236_c0_seq1.p1  ORF type:complete len:120 (+),score=32.13 gnl/MRDRNA2_/MRDRNA2_15236_c0_seq1:134-493(+)